MDIARLAITVGVFLLAIGGTWWLGKGLQGLAATKKAPDALATFNALVEALKAAGKLDEAVQASVIAIREAVAEIAMPLETDT